MPTSRATCAASSASASSPATATSRSSTGWWRATAISSACARRSTRRPRAVGRAGLALLAGVGAVLHRAAPAPCRPGAAHRRRTAAPGRSAEVVIWLADRCAAGGDRAGTARPCRCAALPRRAAGARRRSRCIVRSWPNWIATWPTAGSPPRNMPARCWRCSGGCSRPPGHRDGAARQFAPPRPARAGAGADRRLRAVSRGRVAGAARRAARRTHRRRASSARAGGGADRAAAPAAARWIRTANRRARATCCSAMPKRSRGRHAGGRRCLAHRARHPLRSDARRRGGRGDHRRRRPRHR